MSTESPEDFCVCGARRKAHLAPYSGCDNFEPFEGPTKTRTPEPVSCEACWKAGRKPYHDPGPCPVDQPMAGPTNAEQIERDAFERGRVAERARLLGEDPNDLRAIVRAAMVARHGREDGAPRALAREMAPRWGIAPESAESRLSRWLHGRREMGADDFALMLAQLDLVIVPRS